MVPEFSERFGYSAAIGDEGFQSALAILFSEHADFFLDSESDQRFCPHPRFGLSITDY